MKTIQFLILVVLTLGFSSACSSQSSGNDTKAKVGQASEVEVLYFHFTRRCVTCNAVESVTKETINEIASSQVQFAGYNLDDEEGKAKGEELGVTGQMLIIVAGDTRINLTNEGFMYARSNPDKLKAIIKEKITPFL